MSARLVKEAPATQAFPREGAGNLDLPVANSLSRISHFQGKEQLFPILA